MTDFVIDGNQFVFFYSICIVYAVNTNAVIQRNENTMLCLCAYKEIGFLHCANLSPLEGLFKMFGGCDGPAIYI